MASQLHNPKGFYPADEHNAPIKKLPIAASQTLARGDAVILSSNQVAIALANSAEIAGVVAEACSGLAAATEVKVWADPHTEFIGRASGANAVGVGAPCDIEGATGVMELNENATSTNVVLITGNVDGDEVATAVGKRYKFKWRLHAFADVSS